MSTQHVLNGDCRACERALNGQRNYGADPPWLLVERTRSGSDRGRLSWIRTEERVA
jgi:hypothetical protein